MKKNLNLTETKGDVRFYVDAKGKMYQQLGVSDIFPVADGKITYRHISMVVGIEIKYQKNGCNGFSLFKGKRILEDNIWTYNEAENLARTIKI